MKIKKRILISILLILIILSTNIAVTLAATKSELQNKQNNINQQIKDTENEISAVKEEMSDTMKQIQDLNTQISGYQSEIDDLEYKISDLEKDIEESQEKLNEAEKNYNKQEEAFKNRIVAQYEAGETTYLDVLLGGGSLWDMVSNWYVVSEIADLDNQMLGQMEKNKNEIEEAKKALETNKEQIEVTKKNKEQKASALKSSQATKEQYVNELSDNEKELNAELEKLKKANDAITRELKAMENKYSDKIAYLNHDIDDSIRAGLLHEEQLPKEIIKVLGKNHSERIHVLINDMINETTENLKNGKYDIKQSDEVKEAMIELRRYMFKNIYLADVLKEERGKAKFILTHVIDYFYKHSEELPNLYKEIANEEGLKRGVADYIAGMTDDYCISTFNKIYVPKFVIY